MEKDISCKEALAIIKNIVVTCNEERAWQTLEAFVLSQQAANSRYVAALEVFKEWCNSDKFGFENSFVLWCNERLKTEEPACT